MWKSNFDCAECIDGVKLQHKTSSSLQAPPASSTAHPPFNSHPSTLRSQVSLDSWRQPVCIQHIYASPLLLYRNDFLFSCIFFPFPNTPNTYRHTQLLLFYCFDFIWKLLHTCVRFSASKSFRS